MKTYGIKVAVIDRSSPHWGHEAHVEWCQEIGGYALVLTTAGIGDSADAFSGASRRADLDARPRKIRVVRVAASTLENAEVAAKAYLLGEDEYTTTAGRTARVRVVDPAR